MLLEKCVAVLCVGCIIWCSRYSAAGKMTSCVIGGGETLVGNMMNKKNGSLKICVCEKTRVETMFFFL